MTQLFSRDAAFEFDGVAIGYLKNVRCNINYTVVKEYDDAGEPDVLEYGDASYTFSAEAGYVDETHLDKVLGRNKVSVILYPEGNVTGKDKFTLAGCVCNFELSWTRNAVVLSRITGEGIGVTKGTA